MSDNDVFYTQKGDVYIKLTVTVQGSVSEYAGKVSAQSMKNFIKKIKSKGLYVEPGLANKRANDFIKLQPPLKGPGKK